MTIRNKLLLAMVTVSALSNCAAPEVNNSQPQQCSETDLSDCAAACEEALPNENAVTSTTTCFVNRCACGFTDDVTNVCYALFRTTAKTVACPTTEASIKAFADEESSDEETTHAN